MNFNMAYADKSCKVSYKNYLPVNFVLIHLLPLKLLAVEHANPTKNVTLLNTIIIYLTKNSTIVDL